MIPGYDHYLTEPEEPDDHDPADWYDMYEDDLR